MKGIVFLALSVVVVAALACGYSEEERLAGKHCEASERPAKGLVEDRLNDPGSMEVDKFIISSLETTKSMSNNDLIPIRYRKVWADREKHLATMSFRAKNAFGAMVSNTAVFWIDHEDCTVRILDIG